jgi:hypothetical protein
MRALAAWAARTLGLRGTALLVAGAGWICYGAGIIASPRYGVQRGVAVIVHIMPLTWWGAVWIAFGCAAIVAAVQPYGRDSWGFGAALGPPLMWAMAYGAAAAFGTYNVAWASLPAWCVPVVLILVVARATSRPVHRVRDPDPDGSGQ